MVRAADLGAISSVVERLLHTQEVAGSNPASRTIRLIRRYLRLIYLLLVSQVITVCHNMTRKVVYAALAGTR